MRVPLDGTEALRAHGLTQARLSKTAGFVEMRGFCVAQAVVALAAEYSASVTMIEGLEPSPRKSMIIVGPTAHPIGGGVEAPELANASEVATANMTGDMATDRDAAEGAMVPPASAGAVLAAPSDTQGRETNEIARALKGDGPDAVIELADSLFGRRKRAEIPTLPPGSSTMVDSAKPPEGGLTPPASAARPPPQMPPRRPPFAPPPRTPAGQ